MIKAKDEDGNRLFHPDEILTSKQILSIFSRLAAKKKLETDSDANDIDEEELFNSEAEGVERASRKWLCNMLLPMTFKTFVNFPPI